MFLQNSLSFGLSWTFVVAFEVDTKHSPSSSGLPVHRTTAVPPKTNTNFMSPYSCFFCNFRTDHCNNHCNCYHHHHHHHHRNHQTLGHGDCEFTFQTGLCITRFPSCFKLCYRGTSYSHSFNAIRTRSEFWTISSYRNRCQSVRILESNSSCKSMHASTDHCCSAASHV